MMKPAEPGIVKRRRKPNVARYFKEARKAGETGTVRVEVTDASGNKVTVSSTPDQASTFANPWDEVLTNATH